MYILFDIGGTKTRVVGSENLEVYGDPVKFETPQSFDEGVAALVEAATKVSGGAEITALGGGIRGILDHGKTKMIMDPGGVLSEWEGKPLCNALSEKLGAPVRIENDSAIVGLGEAVFGGGKGYEIVAYHTVSTGVGGAKIENGQVDEVSVGFEPGHQILDIDRSLFGKEVVHSLENLVSGKALERRRGIKPYEIAQDDPVWDELAEYLAYGLRNTIVYWSPDVIVLGGSMIVGDPRILLEDIRRHTKEVLAGKFACPDIVDATLKDEGGLYGAMALLKQYNT